MAQTQRKKKKSNIPMRRRLSALYVKGEEVRFSEEGVVNRTWDELEELKERLKADEHYEDEEGAIYPSEDDIVIYVMPPSPLQREQALREASAARARFVLTARRDDNSENAILSQASVSDMEDDELITFILDMDEADRRQEAERNILADEEWSDFTQLQDAMRQWAEADDPEDDRWNALLSRDLEFGQQVEAEVGRLTEASRESLKIVGRAELEERATKKVVEMAGNAEFMSEYQQWMLHFACRDGDDHDQLAFEDPSDIASMPEIVSDTLATVYRQYIDTEKSAKNSPRAEGGLEQSAPPDEPEITEPSTPEESTESTTSPGSFRPQSTTPS